MKSQARCHVPVYFYCLYFCSQEKCYSGNKIITSFPVASLAAVQVTAITAGFLVLPPDFLTLYRVPHQPTCSRQRPSGLLTLPFLQSCHLGHHQILLISPPKFILDSHISPLSTTAHASVICLNYSNSHWPTSHPQPHLDPSALWSLEESLKAWISLCYSHSPCSEFPLHFRWDPKCFPAPGKLPGLRARPGLQRLHTALSSPLAPHSVLSHRGLHSVLRKRHPARPSASSFPASERRLHCPHLHCHPVP